MWKKRSREGQILCKRRGGREPGEASGELLFACAMGEQTWAVFTAFLSFTATLG